MSSALKDRLKEELKTLVKTCAYRRSETPVQLSSGAWTNEYFDGKQITLFPDRAALLARVILENVDLIERAVKIRNKYGKN